MQGVFLKDLTYSEAIEMVMRANGGVATLKQIYERIWHFKNKDNLRGKTKNNTIQERVQRDKRFFRLGLGIYALTEFREKFLESEPKTENEKQERLHSKIQGMLLEIGNSKKLETYTNDKRFKFKNIYLHELASLNRLPQFTYEKIIKDSVSFCDVVWINQRGFADSIFEVEISSDFRDAFVKFSEMQDFWTNFYCVSTQNRFEKFKKELQKAAFKNIQKRVKFITDSDIEKEYELALANNQSIFN